jgi:hypothetical protein
MPTAIEMMNARDTLSQLSKAQVRRLSEIAWMGERYLSSYEPDRTWKALHNRGLINGLGLTTYGALVLSCTPFANMLRHTPRDC